jgi:outer membrane receptor protein involved in Fe transport
MIRAEVLVSCAVAMLIVTTAAHAALDVTGTVRDPSGAAVAGATVVVMTAERASVATVRTDAQGRFTVSVPAAGRYLLVASAPQLGEARVPITVGEGAPASVEVVLQVGPVQEDITVTARTVDDIRLIGQPVNVINALEILERVDTVVAEAVQDEPGIQLQRTSPTMAGIFVRGLTGNKVNVYLDGMRYSNGAQRGGVNTFLDLIEPDALESVEVFRGPSSAQYGSDALGGSIHFQSRPPTLGAEGSPAWGGMFGASGGTGEHYAAGNGFGSYMGRTLGATASISGRTVGNIRTGDGIDSHAAVTRFFGVPSDILMDDRLPDTGFEQWGTSVRAQWAPTSESRFIVSYARTNQDRGKRYDQLLGGDGNLIADLNDLSLDVFSARMERFGLGMFDHGSFTYSLNSQREERVNQGGNGNPTATIGHEPERTTVHGIQGLLNKQVSARQTLTIGGDVYFEHLASESFNVNPVTGAISPRRPRVPDGARFTQGGVFAQTGYDLTPNRVRLIGAIRVGAAHYEAKASDSPIVNGAPLWRDDSLTTPSVTFRAASVFTPAEPWTISVSVSRGFRAPHMTDLGTLGLTGSGYEVAAPDVEGLGATIGSTADTTAVSTGRPVEQVTSETSLQYEGSVQYRQKAFRTEFTMFVNNVYDNIQKQTLILPPGAVGIDLGGLPITSQKVNGAVFVSASPNPVLVRENFDNARIWGVEHSGRVFFPRDVTLMTVFTYLHTRDTETDRPPNIEGGTPAPQAYIALRWSPAPSRWWVEPYAHYAWKQANLSSLDLSDRRTGASRSRSSIQAFFQNGARARGWIGPGADNVAGTADDLLSATGETLAQIQNRVLGVGVNSSSLFTEVPGYFTFGVLSGVRIGRHQVIVDFENLNDENYRGISWGVDAPGRGISVKYLARF